MKKKSLFSYMDKPLLAMMIIYSCIGIMLVLSSSSVTAVVRYGLSPYYYFIKQIIFVIASFLVGFILVIRTNINKYKYYVPILLVFLIVSLLAILLYGKVTNNAKSWIDLGFFSLQPSEFAKLILILYMAIFFGSNKMLEDNKYRIVRFLVVCAVAIGLVVLQPDLGTAIIISGILFLTFLAIPLKGNNITFILKILAGAVGIVAIVFLLSSSTFLNDMQLTRLEFRNPCSRYTKVTGYQVCNGFIAIHNGGLWGAGIGNSTQKYLYLPEAHTDFAFPILVEELGVIVGVGVIIGYVYILYRIFRIAKSSYNIRNSIICYGIGIYFLLHLLINFLGILALIPLTGVPLPFLSYGGSFTTTIIISLFIVQRIAIENKMTQKKLEINKITGK